MYECDSYYGYLQEHVIRFIKIEFVKVTVSENNYNPYELRVNSLLSLSGLNQVSSM